MLQRQLNVRSDEAYERATRLSKQLHKTTSDIVVDALRLYEHNTAPLDELGLTPDQRQTYDSLRALSKRMAKHIKADAPAGHDWLFDEFGLPK